MGNESSKLIVGFAVHRTRSGQSSSSISLSLQSDLSKGMRKQIFPSLLLQSYNWLTQQLGNVSKAKESASSRTCSEYLQQFAVRPRSSDSYSALHKRGPCWINERFTFQEMMISLYLHNTCPHDTTNSMMKKWRQRKFKNHLPQLMKQMNTDFWV